MATLLLSSVVGSIGGPMGGLLGSALKTVTSQAMAGQLFGPTKTVEGPRLAAMPVLSSTEGAPIPRVYGRARLGGQLIWATRFLETTTTTRSGSSGGKSTRSLLSGLAGGSATDATTYAYAANFAVGLCEGEIAFVRRIWADGKEIDRTLFTHRVHRGTADQQPDPLIVAKEGAENAPAYRGLAYVVFEAFPLADYGNRIPQLSFEVVKPVHGLCDMVRAVDLIPGASEFAYSVPALVQSAAGVSAPENRHQLAGASDWTLSLDALQALCPNLRRVALVVAWFGGDMRAGACRIEPRVETRTKEIAAAPWSCAGWTRATARVVSQLDGLPAYGGTPSDEAVLGALADLRARGLATMFYPFVMMDVPPGNALPDPATGASGQKAYGWRGEIAPAAADGSAAAAGEIAAFFAADNYRRFILHCADLCSRAGGVEAFLLGSELRGLTRARGADGAFPAAGELSALAREVKGRLGAGVKVSYAADWSEFSPLARDGGRELRFPLDSFWASPDVDFVGVDAYFPISDWRPGRDHLDARAWRSVYDRDYLRANVAGGECFDWFYADEAARLAQTRTPISDGACGKPWVFRAKDLVAWWSQPHVERTGGVETRMTPWVPKSKPIWFVEAGCPAVDLGANAPNVFPDVKAERQNIPPFSTGARDDLMQIRMLEAFISRFDARSLGFKDNDNPVSPLYGGRMVDADRIYLWAYDARPFPAFPMFAGVWSDARAWDTGHWLNGRLESTPLDRLLVEILADLGGVQIDPPPIDALVDGYVLDRPLSARAVIEPLAAFFGFDAIVSSGAFRFQERRAGEPAALSADDLAPLENGALTMASRIDDSSLPHEVSLAFSDAEFDYRPASVLSRRLEGATKRHAEGEIALVAQRGVAQRAADVWLQDVWIARERISAQLRPGLAALEPGDLLTLPIDGAARLYRITRASGLFARAIEGRAVDLAVHEAPAMSLARAAAQPPRLPGPPRVEILDLAIASGDPTPLQYLAAYADPWPGPLAIFASMGASYDYAGLIPRAAAIGETLDTLGPGPTSRFDRTNVFRLRMSGHLSSASDADLLAGRNRLALRGGDGAWEIIGFGRAELVAENVWRLSRLLRGLGGEEHLAMRALEPGACAVLLDDALVPLAASIDALGTPRVCLIGPPDRDYADPAFTRIEATPAALALRPYSPVRARARRLAAGVEISFIRRTRINGDGWEAVDPPLGETREAYVVEIIGAGGAVKRAISCDAPLALYRFEDEQADFGAAQKHLSLRIAQISAVAGRGFALEATVPVP